MISVEYNDVLKNYKIEKIRAIRFYLRGINFLDLGSENLIEGVSGPIDEMFNKNPKYRKLTRKFVIAIRQAYDNMIACDRFLAKDKKTIDEGVLKFEEKLKELMSSFKNDFFGLYREETGYDTTLLNTSLDFIRIKTRNKEETKSLSPEVFHRNNEFYGFRELFICIFAFAEMIKDKNIKMTKFHEKANRLYPGHKFKHGNLGHVQAIGMYLELRNCIDYNDFCRRFSKAYYNDLYQINIKKK